jgi:hypothetical protein
MPKKEVDPDADSSAGKKPAAKKPAVKKPAAGKPALEQSAAQRPAAEQPPVDQPVADNPLHKKLGLRPGTAGVVIAAPEGDDNPLLPLPDSFSALPQADDLASLDGPFDYIHVFARDKGELAAAFAALRDKLAPNGSLWISWIKQSSGRGGMFGDLNENIIRRIALTHGMVDVKVAALDRDWAALRLVHRKH